MGKYFLTFHTVFILNENVRWLEEFLQYYINLGFEHFYLYDNDGSTGGDGTKTHNKYNFEISTSNETTNIQLFNSINERYAKYITYIKWQPRNEKGQIIYGQENAIRHFITHYQKENTWVAFMDLDEFIFSVRNLNLREYLSKQTSSSIRLIQKKFIDRFLANSQYITQDFRCINDLAIGTEWGSKTIVRVADYKDISNIHNIIVSGETEVVDILDFRFNHYNLNKKQLEWMKSYYKRKDDFEINGIDTSMMRYANLFNPEIKSTNIQKYYLCIGFVIICLYLKFKSKK